MSKCNRVISCSSPCPFLLPFICSSSSSQCLLLRLFHPMAPSVSSFLWSSLDVPFNCLRVNHFIPSSVYVCTSHRVFHSNVNQSLYVFPNSYSSLHFLSLSSLSAVIWTERNKKEEEWMSPFPAITIYLGFIFLLFASSSFYFLHFQESDLNSLFLLPSLPRRKFQHPSLHTS